MKNYQRLKETYNELLSVVSERMTGEKIDGSLYFTPYFDQQTCNIDFREAIEELLKQEVNQNNMRISSSLKLRTSLLRLAKGYNSIDVQVARLADCYRDTYTDIMVNIIRHRRKDTSHWLK